MGLNGKAVLPMVLGLGCDTMATLTTRILETRKERALVTLLLALGVPCSAQLGVVLAMLGSMAALGTLVWAGVVAGTMLGVGWAPRGSCRAAVRLPPRAAPDPAAGLANILIKTAARIEWYLKEAVPLFVLGTPSSSGWTPRARSPTSRRLAAARRRGARPSAEGGRRLRRRVPTPRLRRGRLLPHARHGQLDGVQSLVALVMITLFIPCIANFFMIVKERGWKTAGAIAAFVFPFAVAVGAALNWALRALAVVVSAAAAETGAVRSV